MSEVRKWYIGAYSGEAEARTTSAHKFEVVHQDHGRYFVLDEDFDRVTAERDAALALIKTHEDAIAHVLEREKVLQQHLTAADERADVLEGLLNLAQGHIGDAGLSRDIDAALKPAEGGGDEN